MYQESGVKVSQKFRYLQECFFVPSFNCRFREAERITDKSEILILYVVEVQDAFVNVRKCSLFEQLIERRNVGYSLNLFTCFNMLAHLFFLGGLPFLGRGGVVLFEDFLFFPFHFRVVVVVVVCVALIVYSCSANCHCTGLH